MMVNNLVIPSNWSSFFKEIENKDYFENLVSFLNEEYSKHVCYPEFKNIFKVFELINPCDIKVVILGQDPYFKPNQAQGIAFSVPSGLVLPPSLTNIFKEISNEFECLMDYSNGDLTYLVSQGVFLVNTILTCVANSPLSHNIPEYKEFISDLFSYLNTLKQPLVYMLWGNHAFKYEKLINKEKAYVIKNAHPSPLAANRGGWFNQNQFILCNDYLSKNDIVSINWSNFKLF